MTTAALRLRLTTIDQQLSILSILAGLDAAHESVAHEIQGIVGGLRGNVALAREAIDRLGYLQEQGLGLDDADAWLTS